MNFTGFKREPLIELRFVGNEATPVLMIDDFVDEVDQLVQFACEPTPFIGDPRDYYPGVRKPLPAEYGEQLCAQYLPLLLSTFAANQAQSATPISSAFSITTTAPEQLRPIQTVPHFDSANARQVAIIHYLCDQQHGGTSLYRHRATGYERITEPRFGYYSALLKRQAMAAQLHLNPGYIDGDTPLFVRSQCFAAKMNRAIIYPSNVLHSGDIRPQTGLSCDPVRGRLTISSFVLLS